MRVVPVVGGVVEGLDDFGEGAVFVVVERGDDVDGGYVSDAAGVVDVDGGGEHAHGGDGRVGVSVLAGVVGTEDRPSVGADVDRSEGAGGRERVIGVVVGEELA